MFAGPFKSNHMEETPKKKTNGRRNKKAGHNWELEVAHTLVDRGLYEQGQVVTCRSNSRRLDAAGIDLMHLNEATHGMMRDSIQCKSTVDSARPNYPKLLADIAKAGRPGGVVFWRCTTPDPAGRQVVRGKYAMTTMGRYLELMACEKFVGWLKKQKPELLDKLVWDIEYNLGSISAELKKLGL